MTVVGLLGVRDGGRVHVIISREGGWDGREDVRRGVGDGTNVFVIEKR